MLRVKSAVQMFKAAPWLALSPHPIPHSNCALLIPGVYWLFLFATLTLTYLHVPLTRNTDNIWLRKVIIPRHREQESYLTIIISS